MSEASEDELELRQIDDRADKYTLVVDGFIPFFPRKTPKVVLDEADYERLVEMVRNPTSGPDIAARANTKLLRKMRTPTDAMCLAWDAVCNSRRWEYLPAADAWEVMLDAFATEHGITLED